MNQKLKTILIIAVTVIVFVGITVGFVILAQNVKDNGEGDETTQADTTTVDDYDEMADYSDIEDLSEYIRLGEYKGLTLFSDSYRMSEEDIEDVLEELRAYYATTEEYEEPVSDRGGEEYEALNIDFEWYVDGELVGTEEDQYVGLSELLRARYPAGFASGLIGVKPGDTKTLNLTFSDDKYLNGAYAGKNVTFVVTVNYIVGKYVLPELDDDLIVLATDGKYTNVEDFVAAYVEDIENDTKAVVDNQNSSNMWARIVANATVLKYPEKQFGYYFDRAVKQIKDTAEGAGASYEECLEAMGITEDDIRAEVKLKVKDDLVFYRIVEAENITLSDEEYKLGVQKFATDFGITKEELLAEYGENTIRYTLLSDKAMEHLLVCQNFVVVENGVDYEKVDLSAVDPADYITLGQYRDLGITSRSPVYTDEELDLAIRKLLESKATYTKYEKPDTDTNRVAEAGDVLNIDYVGTIRGEEFGGGKAQSKEIPLMIDNGYIDGFADALLGHKVGDVVVAEVVFPADYWNAEFRRVHATFTVTINSVVGKYDIPAFTDEFVNEYTDGDYTTADDFREYLREKNANSKANTVRNERYEAIMKRIVEEAVSVTYPEEQVMYYYAESFRYNQMIAEVYGVDIDTYLDGVGSSREMLYEAAKENAINDYLIELLIRKENITVDDIEKEAIYEELLETMGMTKEEFIKYNGEDFIDHYALSKKLIDLLISWNIVE